MAAGRMPAGPSEELHNFASCLKIAICSCVSARRTGRGAARLLARALTRLAAILWFRDPDDACSEPPEAKCLVRLGYFTFVLQKMQLMRVLQLIRVAPR